MCLACCCLSCQKNCCWPCTFTFRQCRKCCAPKGATSLPLDDADDVDFDLDGPSTPRRRRSPVLGRRGQLGKMTISNAAPFKKSHSRPPPDQPRRHRYTARPIFQESPPSRRSMILERHAYATPPGSLTRTFDTGLSNDIPSTTSTLTRRDGGHHSSRDNTPAAQISLGPIGTLRAANGHLYNVVSASRMQNSRSHLSLPIDPIYHHEDDSTPHVDMPAPTPTRAESLLSLNSPPVDKELHPRQQ